MGRPTISPALLPRRALLLLGLLTMTVPACSSDGQTQVTDVTTSDPVAVTQTLDSSTSTTVPPDDAERRNQVGYVFPPAPEVTQQGPLQPEVMADLDALWETLTAQIDTDVIGRLGRSGDPRLAWLLVDLLRFIQFGDVHDALVAATYSLTGIDEGADPIANLNPWQSFTDHLIAWDLPAHPGYVDYKSRLFTVIEPGWQPFFDDEDATIDWRLTSWGGVLMDDRELGDSGRCPGGCIPALDDPSVTDAAGGEWYPDDRIVFGVVVQGEARAYPKHQMEVHEMVNDTLGGRRLGIPYCTLCGSAQAYFTDSVPAGVETPVLRTSGLLTRSNKVMYDLNTLSVLDTFTGEALSGPLREKGLVLEQTSVIASTWGEWKAAYPDTTVVAEDGGIGRSYGLDPLGGRDDDGPIFPIGDVDPRLPVQAEIIGVKAPDGTPIAFPVADLEDVAPPGFPVEFAGVLVAPAAGGFTATLADGTAIASHQAFWFAWSQFNPDTLLWSASGLDG